MCVLLVTRSCDGSYKMKKRGVMPRFCFAIYEVSYLAMTSMETGMVRGG